MTKANLTVVGAEPVEETIEQIQARLQRMASELVAEFNQRLGIMIADAERLAKIEVLPVGVREEIRQLGAAMLNADNRMTAIRGRG